MEVNVLRGDRAAISGDGSGYGYGDGSGDGSGYGDGDGSGYGDGDGDGDGSGSGYWTAVIDQQDTTASARSRGAEVALWRSDSQGRPSNGGSGTVATVGLVEELPGPLQICNKGALHATLDPGKWNGERLWLVALYGEVQREDDKLAALKREFLAEIKWKA